MKLIVAIDEAGGIGNKGKLPWNNIKSDMKFFSTLTTYTDNSKKKNVIIMGRKTYDSIPNKPLKNRINIVLTNNKDFSCDNSVIVKHNVSDILLYLTKNNNIIENSFVIGGSSIYKLFIDYCDTLYVTKIHNKYICDTFFTLPNTSQLLDSHISNDCSFYYYTNENIKEI